MRAEGTQRRDGVPPAQIAQAFDTGLAQGDGCRSIARKVGKRGRGTGEFPSAGEFRGDGLHSGRYVLLRVPIVGAGRQPGPTIDDIAQRGEIAARLGVPQARRFTKLV